MLARIAKEGGFDYDSQKAHGAKYDAELTADIFCRIMNTWADNIGYNWLTAEETL